jgi:hypothetical protein
MSISFHTGRKEDKPTALPPLAMMPCVETTLVPGHPGASPYGAKGAGEIVYLPPLTCIANTIFNATGKTPSQVSGAVQPARWLEHRCTGALIPSLRLNNVCHVALQALE